jgi:hypothetical protein
LADHYGFDSFVQERLHNMRQATKPGDPAHLRTGGAHNGRSGRSCPARVRR